MLKAIFKGILIVIGLLILIPLLCLLATLVVSLFGSLSLAALSGSAIFMIVCGVIIVISLIIIFKD